SAYLLPAGVEFCAQIESLDKSLEDLLTRVDEFVGMLDMIRSESSQVVNESVPQIHTKATEMREIYRKIDKLEVCILMSVIYIPFLKGTVPLHILMFFPLSCRPLLNASKNFPC
ncbi:biogenesis of lysosomal organelles complex 1 subunit 4, partial [Chelydra serpentina]